MPGMSINTNSGAMTALANLADTNMRMETVQNRVSTGLRVTTAKDDAASYSISQRMNSDIAGYESVKIALGLGDAATGVAVKAGEAVKDLLIEMKAKIVQADSLARGNDNNFIDQDSAVALREDFLALRKQLDTIVSTAVFNGINLINNDSSFPSMAVISSVDGASKITVQAQAMDSTSLNLITGIYTSDGSSLQSAALTNINSAINSVSSRLAKLGSAQKQIEIQASFTQSLIDSLKEGVGTLVDADMAQESANLQALQIRQQLGIQSLSIANSGPQSILSLFG